MLDNHEEKLRRRAEAEGLDYGNDLAVSSVYESSESLEQRIPFPFAA